MGKLSKPEGKVREEWSGIQGEDFQGGTFEKKMQTS